MSRRTLAVAAVAALCAAGLVGCPRPPREILRDPARLVERVRAAPGRVRSLSGEMKLDVLDRKAGARGRAKVKALFALERPDRLRIDLLTPMEAPLASLASDGAVFAMFDMGERRFYRGKPTPRNIAHLTRLALAGRDVVAALLGEPPLLASPGPKELRHDRRRRHYLLSARRGEEREECAFDDRTLRPVACTLTRGGALVYRLEYGDWKAVEGASDLLLPRRIRFEQPLEKADVLFLVRGELALNEAFEPDTFSLEVPEGVRIIDLGEGDVPEAPAAPPPPPPGSAPAESAPEGP